MPKVKEKLNLSVFRAILLVVLKEGYLFLRNLYGFFFHPFKTTAKIFREADWSQTLLVFGLPVWLWLFFLFFFLPVLFVFRNHYDLRILLFLAFYGFSLMLVFLGGYFLYWLGKYFRCKPKLKN